MLIGNSCMNEWSCLDLTNSLDDSILVELLNETTNEVCEVACTSDVGQ